MRHLIFGIALGAMLLSPASSRAASSYTGTWSFNMKAVQTTCSDITVGTAKPVFDLAFTQSGKVLEATPTTVGVGEPYKGYVIKGGILMSLGSSCIIVPGGACSPLVESFTFLDASKQSTKVVWISITRSALNEFVCSTVYSGRAAKKKKAKK